MRVRSSKNWASRLISDAASDYYSLLRRQVKRFKLEGEAKNTSPALFGSMRPTGRTKHQVSTLDASLQS
jgi:hypothetical protein